MADCNAALIFQGAAKSFEKSVVFRNLELQVDRGSFVGLAGVNGAGKTTLIKCLLDFCILDAGRITIFGVPHVESRARARLAYLPERFNPPGFLRGWDFLNFSLNLHGADPGSAAIFEMLEELGLDRDVLEKPVRAFSKGMAQKLGLAACFLSEKDILVLDEPMSGLDPKARALVKTRLLKLKDAGKTLLFTSHSLSEMCELCDRLVVLHEGKLNFSGAPDRLLGISHKQGIEQAFLDCIGA